MGGDEVADSKAASAQTPGTRLRGVGLQTENDPAPGSLPRELTTFVGRATEMARVHELLGQARLLTLVGAGGCGKTRLALQAAAREAEWFPDGACWVELAPLKGGELLATTTAKALGLRERPGQAPDDILCEHLRDRRALLILDNCEHVLEACAALVEKLLCSCRHLVVMATSREALQVAGELPYRVPSLNLPPLSGPAALGMESDAVQMFVDRAVRVRPTFTRTPQNLSAVVTICRRLDGIPLAIELAAARMRMLSAEHLAEALDDRFHVLTGGGRSAAPRHQTLRASVDWSHELCSEPERVLLRRLSVCSGGWTLEGAETVCADEARDRGDVLDLLTGLVDKCLVETEERNGEIRYGMLETIRAYAVERLTEAGEMDSTQRRHLDWCLGLAEHAEPELVGHSAASWLRKLELESANLRSSLEWGRANDPVAALRLAGALTLYWSTRGGIQQGITELRRALTAAPDCSGQHGKVLWGLAYLSIWCGQLKPALEYAERALAEGRESGDRLVVARALCIQGWVLALTDHVGGRAPLEASIEAARSAGDQWCLTDATRLLGATYMRQSEHELARPVLEDARTLATALGSQQHLAWYFDTRATGELEQGKVMAARELAEQGAAAAEEIGDAITLGYAAAVLTECDVLQGRPHEGRTRAETYLALMRKIGAPAPQAWLLSALAGADVAEGAPEAALARLGSVATFTQRGGSFDNVTRARRGLAVASFMSGDLDRADGEAQQLLAHGIAGTNEHVQTLAHHLLGLVALSRGAAAEAAAHLYDGLAIASRRDFRLQTLNALESLAWLGTLAGSNTDATRLLAAVRAHRELLGVVAWPPAPARWVGVEERARAALGDYDFVASSAEGAAMSIEEVVAYTTRARGIRKRPLLGWESLTPTELEIVRHAAGGMTNPQIGERMFIGRGTVKTHLAHVFTKLGIASRSELAAEATRRNLC